MHARTYKCCLLLAALMLASCGSPSSSPSTEITPSPGSSVMVSALCGFSVAARSWIDADADGTWDQAENPLAGVTLVLLNDQQGQPGDSAGQSSVGIIGGCEAVHRETAVTAEPPPGFLFTTPQTVPVTLNPDPRSTPMIEFGFRPTP